MFFCWKRGYTEPAMASNCISRFVKDAFCELYFALDNKEDKEYQLSYLKDMDYFKSYVEDNILYDLDCNSDLKSAIFHDIYWEEVIDEIRFEVEED